MIINEFHKLWKKKKIYAVLLFFVFFYSALIIVNLVDNSADEEEISTEQQLEELNYALTDIDKNTEEYQDLQLQVDILEYKLDHNIEESILYDFEILTSGALFYIVFSIIVIFISYDSIIAEFHDRTIIQTLIAPITRTRLFFSKIAANTITAFLLWLIFIIMFFIEELISGRKFGSLFEPSFIIHNMEIISMPVISSIFISLLLNLLTMICIVSVSIFLSLIFNNGALTLLITAALVISSIFIGGLLDQYPVLKYLFTNHINSAAHLRGNFSIDDMTIFHSLTILIVYTVVSYIIGAYIFKKKDLSV